MKLFVIKGVLHAINRYGRDYGYLSAGWKLVLLSFQFIFCRKSGKKEWQRRIKCCYRCEFFGRYRGLATKQWRGEPLCAGCGCYMPAKAMLEKMGCWANENKIKGVKGWKE